jgi:photosystem II stability/assembly factor-like uncharacterized protein
MCSFKRSAVVLSAMLAIGCASTVAALAATDKPIPGVLIKATKTTLLDYAVVGKTLVAVGERGVVMRSDDGGLNWSGVNTASSRTLTAVAFATDKVGVAVGHGGTILRTEDAGLSWVAVKVKEVGQDALLGITVLKNGHFVVCGAFGLYLVSEDLGRTWRRESVIAEDFERHLSRVIEARQAMFLVGETGVMARSTDGGKKWILLKSPYAGSYFGILETGSGALLAFGMRGNVYRSTDQGETWAKMPFDSKSTLNGGSISTDGRVVLAGNNGLIAVSADEGQTFSIQHAPQGTSLSQARLLEGGDIAYVGYMAVGRQAVSHK